MNRWENGDLALCTLEVQWESTENIGDRIRGPQKGSIHAVKAIEVDDGRTWLNFEPWPEAGFNAAYFAKIPPHSPDAEDEETLRLMNGAPVLEPAD